MAAAYSWNTYSYNGTALPNVPQRGYSEQGGPNITRTTMDTGPAKQRKRAASPGTLNVSYLLTTEQVATFEHFVNNVLNGVLRFYYTHPRTNTQVEVRIVPQGPGNLYSIEYAAPTYWNVKFTLEILP